MSDTETLHPSFAFLDRMRPESAAGGYERDSGEVAYYQRINALLDPSMTVVDLGAGRGTQLLRPADFMFHLLKLQGKVKQVIGLDVDPAVAEHPYLDQHHVIDPAAPYPLPDESVDVVVADWVLEHVADPDLLAREVGRILKPGGWFCAHTPNRFGYVALAVNLVPNALHKAVLKRVSPERHVEDVFPTVYRLNTVRALRRRFDPAVWEHYSYTMNPTPRYHANSRILFGLISLYQALMPPPMRTDLLVFMRKRA